MDLLKPVYLDTLASGGFEAKIRQGRKLLADCTVCPRRCRVNRLKGETGECHTAFEPIISSFFAHFGEESPLVGTRGSGTIFIAGCNLQCLFCQNYETSHMLEGRPVTIRRFGDMMLGLQESGCHNINIVTPSHIVPQLTEALKYAAENGLNVPLVYNSGGYDSVSSLRLLEGLVDIYMPDFKFSEDSLAAKFTAVADYATVARLAFREMHRQVGDLVIEGGIARRGLLVRHLVMPAMLQDSRHIFEFLVKDISPDTYINVMPQYRPAGEAMHHQSLNRSLRYSEFGEAVRIARKIGLHRLDKNF